MAYPLGRSTLQTQERSTYSAADSETERDDVEVREEGQRQNFPQAGRRWSEKKIRTENEIKKGTERQKPSGKIYEYQARRMTAPPQAPTNVGSFLVLRRPSIGTISKL